MESSSRINRALGVKRIVVLCCVLLVSGCGGENGDSDSSTRESRRDYSQEAREYYEANREQFLQPQSRLIGHILVRDRLKAQQLYRQLDGNERAVFARLALRHSIDRSSSREGGTMTVFRGQSIPAIDQAAFGLRTGQLSRPFKSSAGYHLVLALEPAQPQRPKPFAQVRLQIEAMLKSSSDDA